MSDSEDNSTPKEKKEVKVSSKKLVINKIIEDFNSKIVSDKDYTLDELKSELTESFKTFKKKKTKVEGAEKRKPSSYNLFIKDKMQEIKKENPTKDNKEIMSMAASMWKQHKIDNPSS